MVSLQLLSIFQITIILCTTSLAYPVFGNKRYNGRSLAPRNINNYSWGNSMQPYQQFVRSQRFPVNYYEMYPYNRDYQDDYYYPQESISYPVYYPHPRTSKYEVYQAVLPYYYGERPLSRQDFAYYGYDKNLEPVEDLEEEMIQEVEREEREEAQPIGQEVLYENEGAASDDNLDDVNAAFLQNLIISQMYKDNNNNNNNNKQKDYYDQYANTDYYFDEDNYGRYDEKPLSKEDSDVRELKQLANAQKPSTEERLKSFRNTDLKKLNKQKSHPNNKYNLEKRPSEGLKMAISTTSVPKDSLNDNKRDVRKGQKEEVLMRPATPIKHPFSSPVLQMMKSEPERKREPSVYDTIKHMLDMEKSLENTQRVNELRAPMRKRIISTEDSLTQQLSVLKKSK